MSRVAFAGTEIDEERFGGRLEFARIKENRWLISEWEITRPVLLSRAATAAGFGMSVEPVAFPVKASGEVLALVVDSER